MISATSQVTVGLVVSDRNLRQASAPIEDPDIPHLSSDLIDRLNESYPPRCKTLTETEEQHQRYAGVRDLLDELVAMLAEQNNEDQT